MDSMKKMKITIEYRDVFALHGAIRGMAKAVDNGWCLDSEYVYEYKDGEPTVLYRVSVEEDNENSGSQI